MKWTKAVINLECQSNFLSSRLAVQMQLDDRKSPGIHLTDAGRIQDSLRRIRHTGSAIYFLHNKKYYLITARHVVEDTSSYRQPEIYFTIFFRSNGSDLFDNKPPEMDLGHYIQLTRQRPLNEVPFIFSKKEDDLAVISLNDIPVCGRQFINILNQQGYVPITISDIDTLSAVNKNDKLMAIGFPDFSEIYHRSIAEYDHWWQPYAKTVPVITKGLVEKSNKDTSNIFSGNIFVYKGFSGGPVLKDNKLVGINRAYTRDVMKTNDIVMSCYIIENSIFTKTKYIMPMLRALESRLAQK